MSAYVIDSVLFRDQFGTGAMRAIFSDEQTVQKWLDVEAALAKVQADLDIIPIDAATEIQKKAKVENIDLKALKEEMDRTAHPIVPLLRAMKKACEGDAAEYIHWGATTQDIVDTGTVLQMRAAFAVLERSYLELIENVRTLAEKHKNTVMVGRTHGQQALPITFGFKVATWAAELQRNYERLKKVRKDVLVGQFFGAVGTLASLPNKGALVQQKLNEELGLAEPVINWHTARDGLAELTSVLAIACATPAKIANEVFNLQKTEIGELEEPFADGKVGSSTMPHKRNPPVCEGVLAINRVVRATVPLALEGMVTDFERDKVALQVEREYISRLFNMVHSAVMKMCFVTKHLHVRVDNMEKNLHTQGGLLMSEAVMMSLGKVLGRQEAHDILYEICMKVFEQGGNLKESLMAHPTIQAHLSEAEVDAMLDPHVYTGLSQYFVDRVLATKIHDE